MLVQITSDHIRLRQITVFINFHQSSSDSSDWSGSSAVAAPDARQLNIFGCCCWLRVTPGRGGFEAEGTNWDSRYQTDPNSTNNYILSIYLYI